MGIKFLAGIGKNFYDMSELVVKATLSGRKGSAPRSLSVTLADSEEHGRSKINCGKGYLCTFYKNDKELFRGLIMTDDAGSKRQLTIKAYDNCIYLSNNKDSFSYKNKRADEIFVDCLKRLKLPIGKVSNTGHVIGELVKPRTTYWDVIQDALSQTYASTGKRYYVSSAKGKISLKRRKEQANIPVLDVETNIETYSRKRSIYNSRTRLKLTTSKGSVKKEYVNSSLEKQIGMFQDVDSVDEDITANELQQRINTFKEEKALVERSLEVNGTGIASVISGNCVYVRIPQISTKRLMYVDEDTHTFEHGCHKMKLKLNYASDIDKAG